MAPEPRRLRSQRQCGQLRALFQVADLWLHPRVAEGAKESLFYITSPIQRAPPSWPHHLLKAPPSRTIILGIIMSTYEFWGTDLFRP